jgi:plastocyanin
MACEAAELSITIVDRDGRGVGDAVVTLSPAQGAAGTPSQPKSAIMDQRDRTFVPRVLVVSAGTSVEFPNNDSVSHQVYSFSPAKRFQLPLYKGEIHPPITFDQPGLVVLGCNIHDSMVGYIYVTPAPYFGTTGSDGGFRLKDIPKGGYQLTVWSPYIADSPASLSRTVQVEGSDPVAARFQLTEALRARPEPKPRRRDWEY